MHLVNPAANTNDHITNLLFVLMNDGIQLAVDDRSVIENEYLEKIAPKLSKQILTWTSLSLFCGIGCCITRNVANC